MTREERWSLALTQAQRFAQKESFVDAVARARSVRDEISAALSIEVDAGARRALEGLLRVAERAHGRYLAAFEAWNAKIAEGRAARIANAAAEQAAPLPALPIP